MDSQQSQSEQRAILSDRLDLGTLGRVVFFVAGVLCLAGVTVALIHAGASDDNWRRVGFAYVTSYAFCLSIALGALFFVTLQHLTRAGWSVTVRRLAELLASTLPLLCVLFVPILPGRRSLIFCVTPVTS